MATVGESIALGTLLAWICGRSLNRVEVPTSDEAFRAACQLLDKQRATGACCYNAETLRAHWPAKKDVRRPAKKD